MSMSAWSGTAQLAAIGLLGQPLTAVFASSLLVSLRFVPMSLAVAGMLPDSPRWHRVLAACGLADASFALMVASGERSLAYLLGTWLAQYGPWVLGTAAGALAAPLLPDGVLAASDVLVAVIFVVLAVSVCTGRPDTAVAVLGALLAVVAGLVLPSGIALPIAAVVAAGLGAAYWR